MERYETINAFIKDCVEIPEEGRLDWIERLAKKMSSSESEMSIAVASGLIDNLRYAIANKHISDYNGGFWKYYSKFIELEDGTKQEIMLAVLDEEGGVHVYNEMNYSDFPNTDPVTASCFVWSLALFHTSYRLASERGMQYADDVKYALIDMLPKEEAQKFISLMD